MSLFNFKKFALSDDHCAMKIGMDGVLLGAFVSLDGVRRVLDVGTGCGLLSLMIAQRACGAMIEAIDIDEAAISDASLNFDNSGWGERLSAVVADFNEYKATEKYDLIVSNPPFFEEKVVSPEVRRRMARSAETLSYWHVLSRAKEILTSKGSVAMILPATLEEDVAKTAVEMGFFIARRVRVVTAPNKPPKRILWEFSLDHTPRDFEVRTLVLGSEEQLQMTNDFYI